MDFVLSREKSSQFEGKIWRYHDPPDLFCPGLIRGQGWHARVLAPSAARVQYSWAVSTLTRAAPAHNAARDDCCGIMSDATLICTRKKHAHMLARERKRRFVAEAGARTVLPRAYRPSGN